MKALLAAAVAIGAVLVPNEPAPGWYAIPEIACDLVTSDQDQWRCDEDPVAFQRGVVPARRGGS